MNLAQEAYEAYANHTGWKSLATGQPLPEWEALPQAIKTAWTVSTAWVVGKTTGQHNWKYRVKAELRHWLDNDFRHACASEKQRLNESLLMLKVGLEAGDVPEEVMARSIASFVKGLILGEQPITVPIENN